MAKDEKIKRRRGTSMSRISSKRTSKTYRPLPLNKLLIVISTIEFMLSVIFDADQDHPKRHSYAELDLSNLKASFPLDWNLEFSVNHNLLISSHAWRPYPDDTPRIIPDLQSLGRVCRIMRSLFGESDSPHWSWFGGEATSTLSNTLARPSKISTSYRTLSGGILLNTSISNIATTFKTLIRPTAPRTTLMSEETSSPNPNTASNSQLSASTRTSSSTTPTSSFLSPDGRMSLAFAVPNLIIGVTAVWIAWRTLAWMKIQQEVAQRQIASLMNVQINLQLLGGHGEQ